MTTNTSTTGKKDQVVGKTKEVVGGMTGDEDVKEEGRAQNIAGHLKEAGSSLAAAGKHAVKSIREATETDKDD